MIFVKIVWFSSLLRPVTTNNNLATSDVDSIIKPNLLRTVFLQPTRQRVYFTHRIITFCLPPSVIIHFYVTHVFKNVFYFTSLAPRSIFVYLAFVLVPHDIFLLTWHFVLGLFYYPIIWRSYFLCTSPLSTWYHLIFVSHLVGLPLGALKGNLVVIIS